MEGWADGGMTADAFTGGQRTVCCCCWNGMGRMPASLLGATPTTSFLSLFYFYHYLSGQADER